MSSRKPITIFSRRQMLRSFASLAATGVLTGCGSSLYHAVSSSVSTRPTPLQPSPAAPVPAGQPLPPPTAPESPVITDQPLPIGAVTAMTMTVDGAVSGYIDQDFVGLAYEKRALTMPVFHAANDDLISLFKLLGRGVLRIGGPTVDETVWTPHGSGQTFGQIAPSDISALANFLQATGWTCIYGINLGGSATGATTPLLAAAEVAYVAQQLGSSLAGIELGNECENYGNPDSYYPNHWDVEIFESLWKQYRDAIVASTPNAPLSGPAAASNVDGWTIPFGEYVTSSEINLLTQHYNRGPASAASLDDLISPDTALAGELLQLKYGAQSIGVPYRITGCNSYADGGVDGVSNAYASALWSIDMFFNCALGGAAGVNFQGGGQAVYAPVQDNDGLVTSAQPIFYGLLLASMAGGGNLLSTQFDAGGLNVTSYAVQSSNGGLSLVVVNKDATQNLDLSISLPQSMSTATAVELRQLSSGLSEPSLEALSGVTIQGATVGADGSFNPSGAYNLTVTGSQLSCYIPALSAVLIQLT